jgi:tetratricopeptide (TPR) repeat protein
MAVTVLILTGSASWASAQEPPNRLFEAGNFQGAVQGIPDDAPPDALYLKGLAYRRLGQNDQAKEVFGRLGGAGDQWGAVGSSAVALTDGNLDAALEAANAGVAANPGLAEAQYQLGSVLDARGDAAGAAAAFASATSANPQMAYAHYNAGMNFYKAKRVDQMAVFFENFLKLAPNAPERPAVESIMRTLRGR